MTNARIADELEDLELLQRAAGDAPVLAERWSTFSEDQRADGWRVGGTQQLALHAPTGRLYSLVHRGERGSHKDAGMQIWVYDMATREPL